MKNQQEKPRQKLKWRPVAARPVFAVAAESAATPAVAGIPAPHVLAEPAPAPAPAPAPTPTEVAAVLPSMPNEVLTEVFKFFGDQRAITRRLSRVSHRFHGLVTRNHVLQDHLCEHDLCRREEFVDLGSLRRVLRHSSPHNVTITGGPFAYRVIEDKGVSSLVMLLQHNTTIHSLDISCNGLSPNGIVKIAEMLKVNTTLKNLNLSGNDVGSHGACHLAEALKCNTSLRRVNLYSTDIRDNGGIGLIEALEQNSTLCEINLTRNWVSNEVRERLREVGKRRGIKVIML